jgi:site-specific DNA-methyltransferase (adenine-specific)
VKPYYEQDGITIYHGDCREVLPHLADFGVVLTDPPYGVGLGTKARNQKQLERMAYATYDDTDANLTQLIREAFPLIRAKAPRLVMTPGVRNMWLWPKPDHVGSFFYPSASGCNSWGFSCWQPIFYYGPDPFAGKGSRPDSFMSVEAAEPNGHPCPKPVGQWTRLMNRACLPGETILDPFMGSGTTLRVAKDCGHHAVGVEMDERYCEIAAKRLAQGVLFGAGGAA